MTSDPQKNWWTQKNYLAPAAQVKAAIEKLLATPEFAGIRRDALACYFDKLIGSGLARAMQSEATLEDLKALSPDSAKAAQILLIRDFLRHFGDRLVPQSMQGWKWVERFTVRLLELSETPVESYVQWLARQKADEDEDPQALLTGLARQLHIDPKTLWNFHRAMCDIVEEDVLDAQPASNDRPATSTRPSGRPRRNSPLKRLLGTLAGVVVAVAVVAGNEYLGSKFFPVPVTLNMRDTPAVNAFIATLPVTALLLVLFGWFFGTLVGGSVAIRLANTGGNRPAWMVALALGVAASMDLMSFVHPVWFWIAALALIPGAGATASLLNDRRNRRDKG